MRTYPPEIAAFIAENYKGITTNVLTEKVNAAFGTTYSSSRIRSYKQNHKLRSGVKPGTKESYFSKAFPHEVCEYIRANYKGVGPTEMTRRVNAQFAASYSAAQLKSYYHNHSLDSGIKGYFQKGQVPFNKGKKGTCAPGCEKGWFKKGSMPHTHRPVGTESFRSDGYWWVKVAEPNKWREKHVLVWEAAHGKRPPGHTITFLDSDRSNFDLDNLALITQAENAVMARCGYRSDNADFTQTGILLARVKMAKTAAKKKIRKRGKTDDNPNQK